MVHQNRYNKQTVNNVLHFYKIWFIDDGFKTVLTVNYDGDDVGVSDIVDGEERSGHLPIVQEQCWCSKDGLVCCYHSLRPIGLQANQLGRQQFEREFIRSSRSVLY